jgi:peptidyl-prolyl cis-trans isomerase D
MLDFLRKRKRSWIITFLLGLIIIVFVAFYGGSTYRDAGSQDVAQVNGEVISQREFGIQYQRMLERYREMFKGSLTPEMLKSLNIKGNLLEELIRKRLLLQEARALGLSVSDDELAHMLSQVPEFHVGGRFNKERYVQLLRANKMTPAEFEEEQRAQLTIQRLYGTVLDAVQVSEAEVRERYRIENEKLNLFFIRLPVAEFLSEVKVTDDEIQSFYERNKESVKQPLKVQLEYLSYPFDQFASSAQITEKDISDYYEANRDSRFRKPKEVKVRYISLRLDPQADANEKEKLRARANAIIAEARSGKDFAQLARKESDDPTSATGGDVGWLVQGQLPPEIEKNVFGLARGEVSNVIETPGGFQIVKIEDVREEKTLTLKEVSAEITRTLKTEHGKREAAKIAERDRNQLTTGGDINKIAQQSGIALKTTGLSTSGDVLPEIGPNPDFYKTAFALRQNEVSALIEGEKAYYVVRAKQRVEPAVPALDAVKAEVEKRLKESKARELMLQRANGLLDQLKKEKKISEVAQQNRLKLEETGFFLRNAQQLPKIGELPELRPGGITLSAQRPIADRIYVQKDAAYVFALKESQSADMERFEKEREKLMEEARAESRQRIAQKYVDELKAKANIRFDAAVLEEG